MLTGIDNNGSSTFVAIEVDDLPPVDALDERRVNRFDGIVNFGFGRRQQIRVEVFLFGSKIIFISDGIRRLAPARPVPHRLEQAFAIRSGGT